MVQARDAFVSTPARLLPGFALAALFVLALVGGQRPAAAQSEQTVSIAASDAMKYNVTAITGHKDEPIVITLTNQGSLPKAAMAHNLVILKPGTNAISFAMAASAHKADDYIPKDKADQIIAATKLLGPGESDTITFLPAEAGAYPFVCTFPAHALAGMHGVITVQ